MRRSDEPAATSSPRIVAAIPARLGSTRLPEKPLADLAGVPLVARVYGAVRAAEIADAVYVVTDSDAIEAAVRARGGLVLREDAPCRSGTERIARALLRAGLAPRLVLNVQGDEPFVERGLLAPLLAALEAGADIATLAAPLPPEAREARDRVKVVCDARGHALYFSRAPIPGDLHLGYYGFQGDILASLPALPRSPLAAAEDLEQLDWLHAGLRIAVARAPKSTLSIDTPADLAEARRLLAAAETDRPEKRMSP